jgi:protein-S-isoprenylcysteine O-methyltransferase Ste14
MDLGVFVPISLFASVAAVLVLFMYYRFRARHEYQKTVRNAIERGQQLTPELLDHLENRQRDPQRDLRMGAISIALGVSLGAFGYLVGEDDAIRPFLAIGNVPLLVGIALVLLWKFAPRES